MGSINANDAVGTFTDNINGGGTLDLLESVDLTSGNVTIVNSGTVNLGGSTKLNSLGGSGTYNIYGTSNTITGDFSVENSKLNFYITPSDMDDSGSNHTGDFSTNAPSPSVKGDSGILELGWKGRTANNRFETGIGLLGSVGRQRGIGGHIELKWIF